MAVLVTRPEIQGLELCQQLAEVGISAIHHPLIQIQAGVDLPLLLPDIHNCDIILAVSQHAVTFSHQFLQDHRSFWPNEARYLAVGQKTAHVLSKLSQQKVHYPAVSDSEHLLEMPLLQSISGLKIMILRGNGGRELLHNTLTERGAKVTYKEVYQRTMLAFSANQHAQIWQQQNVHQLVVTSGEQLEFLVTQMSEIALPWLFNLHLFVPSERIRQAALLMGFSCVTNVKSASNTELVATLSQHKQDSKHDK
ncbi:uroporphyrinogen-III synthase [Vibrio aestuarianus]|uniref:Uroporphyrinogen-III synthase n=1 Tax=Vibrio aestuarianus TaxID=28171 RepID=A0AAX3U204_9VIBR|nr:uroporphyrinogen-III synthase [Vibrio aestuarianus]MDE1211143.1 uroporphyrinogen-III synthase [Vibrio aestuarianus]MDE1220415.1 uroporphyrinogen-III synthase [Vibrio aestuarianus]MDE1225843.1 uroporphyrinogen-III synthase [Vibrio aestuarianus]MDE1340383.1 uroporphyrinogen-III synthase [Vibrio aestuarianus]WGK81524.1 uroporphyrinogen-III synthase [Vibrio aestuarianus]